MIKGSLKRLFRKLLRRRSYKSRYAAPFLPREQSRAGPPYSGQALYYIYNDLFFQGKSPVRFFTLFRYLDNFNFLSYNLLIVSLTPAPLDTVPFSGITQPGLIQRRPLSRSSRHHSPRPYSALSVVLAYSPRPRSAQSFHHGLTHRTRTRRRYLIFSAKKRFRTADCAYEPTL